MNQPTTCPNCGAIGVQINAHLEKDGYQIRDTYCGRCGKNWPQEPSSPRDRIMTHEDL